MIQKLYEKNNLDFQTFTEHKSVIGKNHLLWEERLYIHLLTSLKLEISVCYLQNDTNVEKYMNGIVT